MVRKRRLNPESIRFYAEFLAQVEAAEAIALAEKVQAEKEAAQRAQRQAALEESVTKEYLNRMRQNSKLMDEEEQGNRLAAEAYIRAKKLKEHKRFRGNRWYDSVENMADAVDFIKFAPKDIQMLLVRHINEEFNRNKYNFKKKRESMQTGQEKLKHIYYSQMHQRWQDQDPLLRRMFVLLTTFPNDFLVEFSQRVLMVCELCHNAHSQGRAIDFRQVEAYFNRPYRVFMLKSHPKA